MTAFPGNVVSQLVTTFTEHFPTYPVTPRSVRPIDPHGTIGITAEDWEPIQGSEQIGQVEPALNRYKFSVQNLTLSDDEAVGREHFANTSKMIRVILYRDSDLHVALSALEETQLFSVERFKRAGVSRQRYLSGQLKGIWNFVATTSFWIETEITQL